LTVGSLQSIVDDLVRALRDLPFGPPVTHVYNPLEYARGPHLQYLERFGGTPKEALFLGMNPGPWGMAQTGVPFGEIALVRDWMGIGGEVGRPEPEHPKRPIEGFDCARSEVSGGRLWGWARDRFGTPERFFERFFVWNYCPLVFMEESGRNRTPDKLPAAEKEPLFEVCDRALARAVEHLSPQLAVGVGRFAESRLREVLGEPGEDGNPEIGTILHPSPASPAANRGWAEQAEAQLRELGVALP
jgi:single-strand selective monofunctional uracil DNA glycosylase